MSVLNEHVIEQALAHIKAQLIAHEDDIFSEIAMNDDGKAQITFRFTVQRVDADRYLHKLSTRIPRQAIKPDDISIDERQSAIPFKAVAK